MSSLCIGIAASVEAQELHLCHPYKQNNRVKIGDLND